MSNYQLFQSYQLNQDGLDKSREMTKRFTELTDWLCQLGNCSGGRELSIVKTKLEEACFFARKALAMNPINQQDFGK